MPNQLTNRTQEQTQTQIVGIKTNFIHRYDGVESKGRIRVITDRRETVSGNPIWGNGQIRGVNNSYGVQEDFHEWRGGCWLWCCGSELGARAYRQVRQEGFVNSTVNASSSMGSQSKEKDGISTLVKWDNLAKTGCSCSPLRQCLDEGRWGKGEKAGAIQTTHRTSWIPAQPRLRLRMSRVYYFNPYTTILSPPTGFSMHSSHYRNS